MRGQYSIKSDVFSFGVLVLEIVTGRRNSGVYNSEQDVDLLNLVSVYLMISRCKRFFSRCRQIRSHLNTGFGAGLGALDEGKCGRADRSVLERPSSHGAEVPAHRATVCSKKPCSQADDVVGKRHAEQQHCASSFSFPASTVHPGPGG